MSANRIYYQSIRRYKYELLADYRIAVGVRPVAAIIHKYFSLFAEGQLIVKAGYMWDGPSGPAIDTKNFMRGSLIHDCLYQMMRLGLLDVRKHRRMADKELHRICREDGMCKIRAYLAYWAVQTFARRCAKPTTKPEIKVLTAP